MKAVRCPNGHWYDSEIYDHCPHCGQTNDASKAELKEEKSQKKKFGLFKKEKKSNKPEISAVAAITPKQQNKSQPETSATQDDVTEQFFADIDDDKTVAMFEADGIGDSDAKVESAPVVYEKPPVEKKVTSEPLAAAVQRVSAMDEGKTLSFFNTMTTQKESSTNSVNNAKTAEPVVGWLIAVSGVHFGESFSLFVGKNAIGRNNANKVVLGADQSVSRENHATVIYEPKRREFYLQPGSSDGLVYLNDAFINNTQVLKRKDVIELGSTKLMFIPLCDADFSWEQYM